MNSILGFLIRAHQKEGFGRLKLIPNPKPSLTGFIHGVWWRVVFRYGFWAFGFRDAVDLYRCLVVIAKLITLITCNLWEQVPELILSKICL